MRAIALLLMLVMASFAAGQASPQDVDAALGAALNDANARSDDARAQAQADGSGEARDYGDTSEQMRGAAAEANMQRWQDANQRLTAESQRLSQQASQRGRGGGCGGSYNLSSLRLSDFQDPKLAATANELRNGSPRDAIAKAKEGGYDKQSAYNAAMAQANQAKQGAQQSAASARALVSGQSDVDRYSGSGLPANYQCGGAAGAAVCAYFIDSWIAEISRQTAEAIQCGWDS